MRTKLFCVYILASKPYGTLYIGVTAHLKLRIWQHKNQLGSVFTKRYKVNQLVFYQIHSNAKSAIAQEKQIKQWKRSWKIHLIQRQNPKWEDLFDKVDF